MTILTGYFTAKGRMGRSEFALRFFAIMVIIVAFLINENSLGLIIILVVKGPILTCLYIRRFHDINKSGWWSLIPLVLPITIIILMCWPGDKTDNKFGPARLSFDNTTEIRPDLWK